MDEHNPDSVATRARRENAAGADTCARYALIGQACGLVAYILLGWLLPRPRTFEGFILLAYSVPLLGLVAAVAAVFAAVIQQRAIWLLVPVAAFFIAVIFYFAAAWRSMGAWA